MRNRVLLMLVVPFGLMVTSASGADVTGKWVAQIPGRNGTMEQTFTFKQSGQTLTGTISSQRGDQEISEGKVAGDSVSFVTVMKFGGQEMKMVYKGTVAGDEIEFTRSMEGGAGGGRGGGGPMEFVAKKGPSTYPPEPPKRD